MSRKPPAFRAVTVPALPGSEETATPRGTSLAVGVAGEFGLEVLFAARDASSWVDPEEDEATVMGRLRARIMTQE
jgi:hypothetical protein